MSCFSRISCLLFTLATIAGARADVTIQALNSDVSLVTGVSDFQTVQVVQADGKLVINTPLESTGGDGLNSLARYSPEGAVDPSFDASGLQARLVQQLVALPGGKTLVVGRFGPNPNAGIQDDHADDEDDTAFAPDPDVLVRLNADGSRDATFQSPGVTLSWISAVNVLRDGSLLLSGYHPGTMNSEATSLFGLVHLTADGQVDASFHGDFPADVYVTSIHVQSDGRILVVAEVGDDTLHGALFRLNADGSPDPTFQSGLATGVEISAVALLADGRVIVATYPDDDATAPDGSVIRLNGDGSVDAGFAVPSSFSVSQLVTLEGGSVLAKGDLSGSDEIRHSAVELIDVSGSVKLLSGAASSDAFDSIAPLTGGGFAAGLVATAADGTQSGALGIFDAAGTIIYRTPISGNSYAVFLLPRPAGGVYAVVSANANFFATLQGAGTFNPPPAPGVSIKAGPTVRIDVLRSEGHAGAGKKAKFLLTRDGDLSRDLKVTYQVRGTAVSGRDYVPLRGQKIIKAGRATAKIKVRPTGGRLRSGEASVKLMLMGKRAYSVGTPAVAKVYLLNQRGAKSKP